MNRLGIIASHNGRRKLNTWSGECNRIDGSEGTIFPPFLTPESDIHLYLPLICKRFPFVFNGSITMKDVDGYRFRVKDNVFASPKENPENECYCIRKSKCTPGGLFDARSCFFGTYISVFVGLTNYLIQCRVV